MLDHAKQFFEKVLPLPALTQEAYCNVHWRSVSDDGKTFWGGRAARTIDELTRQVWWASNQANIKDIYFCTSLQGRAEDRVSKAGRPYKSAVRLASEVVALRSLFLDMDVKPGQYATQAEALVDLRAFLTATGLPIPTAVVSSGSGGMHVYWSMDQAITQDEWQVLAHALANACRQYGLKFDSQCTVDSVRIMRVPGTTNSKPQIPAPVTLMSLGATYHVDQLRTPLAPYEVVVPPPVVTEGMGLENLPKRAPTTEGSELSAGIESAVAPLPMLMDVATTCGFVREAVDTGGAAYTNPLWFLTTIIASYCDDSRAMAHKMAAKHPGYTTASTDELFDRVTRAKQTRDMGWPSCAKITGTGATACATCPMRSAGKSPLNYTTKPSQGQTPALVPAVPAVPVPTAAVDPLPDGYLRGNDGIVYRRVTAEDGTVNHVEVLSYPMRNAWLQDNPWALHFSTRNTVGATTKFELPFEIVSAKDSLLKAFGRQGLTVRERQVPHLKEFLVSWIQKLQTSKDSVVSSAPFGWSIKDGKIEGFTYAGRVWMKDGDRPAASPDPVIKYQYSPKGEIKPWLEAVRMQTATKRPAIDAIIAASFGGPLVRFTGQSGVMLSCYSPESGIGKSTAMKTAQAVWGDPAKAMQSLSDTQNSVFGKLGTIKALPVFWDELKTESETAKFVTISFQLTQGKEKSRMTSEATLREVGTWQTLMVSASNDSLVDPVQRATKTTTAGLYRLYEFVVPRATVGMQDGGAVLRTTKILEDNYGAAGLIYSKFLGANHERVAEEVAELQDSLSNEAGASSDERFWLATMAVTLAGARYGNELGLTDIDEPALKEFLVTVLGNMRKEIADTPSNMRNQLGVLDHLQQFLNAMSTRHTIITNRIHIGAGKPQKGTIQIKSDISKLDGVYVQIGLENRLMRISSTYLTTWLKGHNMSRHAFVKALEEEFGCKLVNGRMAGGTDLAINRVTEYLLELDISDPRLQPFFEW